jgi:hypothetical protein
MVSVSYILVAKGEKSREKNSNNNNRIDVRTMLGFLRPKSAMVLYGHGAAGCSSATKPTGIATPKRKQSKFLTKFIAADPADS